MSEYEVLAWVSMAALAFSLSAWLLERRHNSVFDDVEKPYQCTYCGQWHEAHEYCEPAVQAWREGP